MPFVEYCERCTKWLLPGEYELCAKCADIEYGNGYDERDEDDMSAKIEREEGR